MSVPEEDLARVEDDGGLLKIGEVSEIVGLSLRTVRYYEEVGLFTPSGRSPGGFRLYAPEDVERLRILKGMKPFGASLEDIRELMALLDRSDELEELDEVERGRIRGALAAFHERADARLTQLAKYSDEVRRLRGTIEEAMDRLARSA